MEEWRDHPTVDFIQVSSYGRVQVKPYQLPLPNGGFRTYGGQPHFGSREKDGRMVFINRTRRFRKRVHILVCETFHGEKPFDGAVVMHLDDNPSNNRTDNLKWGSQKENLNADKFIAYCKSKTGENSNWHKHFTRN